MCGDKRGTRTDNVLSVRRGILKGKQMKTIVALGVMGMMTTVCAEDELDKYFAHSAEAIEYVKNVMFYAHGFDKKPTDGFQQCSRSDCRAVSAFAANSAASSARPADFATPAIAFASLHIADANSGL